MNHLSIIRNTLLTAGLFILLAFSTYKLSEAPAIWYDEGFYTQIAMNFTEQGKQLLQTAPNTFVSNSYITVGYPLIIPLATSYKLFGVGVVQGRGVMTLFIIGFATLSYLLIRKLFGPLTAAWALLLLATFPMLYGNGKAVLGEVPGLFFLVATLVALWHLEKTAYRNWRWYAAVGTAAGLCVATKPFFILLLIALFLTLLLKLKSIRLNWYGVGIGFFALSITLGMWAWLQFGGDASAGSILADYANPYSIQNLPAHIAANALRFLTESTPLYTLLLMLVWGVALFLRRKNIPSPELAAFIFCLLAIGSYLRLEGWYRYLFPATILALVFLPSSCQVIFKKITTKIKFLSKIPWLPYAFLLLLATGQLYQTVHTSYVAQYYESTRTKDISTYLSALGEKNIFLYNVPELAILLPTNNYYQYLSPLPTIIIGRDTLAALTNGTPDIVLINTDTYAKNAGLFEKYALHETVGRYTVLQKK